ncbi:DUF1338 domain-containing protein [Terasakiispira papahanaumokuakeensis]|uniref:2-oxoadipate dioxygenase/decarboxylase n=1 Tax=Terasakiispira papahanaumokuakeensis TaxID=197479 RepID=A0A1E2VC27_9GAMM|nr:VOC family protein [Terasakiispira papahanaumokuakeensis]ODC04568.1 DUF1338 domain-containing protein [Terasakiispira papahanaumokuakeensis]
MSFVSSDTIRDRFSQAMSTMYQQEVPQYGTLLTLVAEVNEATLAAQPALKTELENRGELERLNVERHGAIRLGTAAELHMMGRLFAVMGMEPVGYYDLSAAAVPVHSTAFRPVSTQALNRNPFRIFTSWLRLELIEDPALREHAAQILAARDIFTPGVKTLIEQCEQQGGLTDEEAHHFVTEALETFRWHQTATVDLPTYQALHDEHRLIADVVCFKGPHINHLTPRTLDIDEVQRLMPAHGIQPKAIIEGPPRRQHPILLRQTSFQALQESIEFKGHQQGAHTARFGEIEQRGMALTGKGRELYDQLLGQARQQAPHNDNVAHQKILADVFRDFPDDLDTLRRQGLAFFEYQLTDKGLAQAAASTATPATTEVSMEAFIEAGWVKASPLIYEDFLPVSAAGIFQSNLSDQQHNRDQQHDSDQPRAGHHGNASRDVFEAALGRPIIDELSLYAKRQAHSAQAVIEALTEGR